MKGVSLFTGAGGMDVGFEAAGIDVVLANEIDKCAAQTYSMNHPQTTIIVDDVNQIFDKFIDYKGVDMVFGGPLSRLFGYWKNESG